MRGYDGNVTATCQPTFTYPDALSLPIVPRPTTAIIAAQLGSAGTSLSH